MAIIYREGEKLKYFKCIFCIVLIAVVLCGCNFKISSSIDDLISPISPIGDNADVKTALDEYVKNGYTLKTPISGKHITSYTFFDIDNDKEDEAIAFYEPKDNLGSIDMAVIKKVDKNWKVVENINGPGKDVYSLDFIDVNGAKRKELIVCWDVISKSTSHDMFVYEVAVKNNSIKLLTIGESVSVNNYIPVDMNKDKIEELLVFKLGTGSASYAAAELYSYKNDNQKLLGETKLDSHISSYTQIKTEKIASDVRVYADAVSSSGSSMLTELIYWSNSYGTIISPFYSYSSGRTKDTSRNAMIESMDINSDGLIEIPNDKRLDSMPKEVSCINWKVYKKTILIHTDYSLFVSADRYTLIIPDKFIDKISVKYDTKSRTMSVISKNSKKEAFCIMPVLKATYNESDFKDYTKILDDSGYIYLAKIGEKSDIDISIGNLKSYIKSI